MNIRFPHKLFFAHFAFFISCVLCVMVYFHYIFQFFLFALIFMRSVFMNFDGIFIWEKDAQRQRYKSRLKMKTEEEEVDLCCSMGICCREFEMFVLFIDVRLANCTHTHTLWGLECFVWVLFWLLKEHFGSKKHDY